MAFKIYTKTGDKGTTGLFGGKRLPKDDLQIESYGTVDELNACLGLLRDSISLEDVRAEILHLQHLLFDIGAHLATDPEKKMQLPEVSMDELTKLEASIDQMETELPPLKNFILPGGSIPVSHCHLARVVCRRAERRVVSLSSAIRIESAIIPILNRLSDYLFVLGRYIGLKTNTAEVLWIPKK